MLKLFNQLNYNLFRKKIAKFDLKKKYAETNFAKKQAIKAKRANNGDFERFKVMVLKKKVYI